MPQVFFVHFLPFSEQGTTLPSIEPHVSTEEIHIPTEDEVYEAWSDAAYDIWGEEGDFDYETFSSFGNSAMYYAAYMIITDKEMSLPDVTEILDGIIIGCAPDPGDPEELSDRIMKEMPGVVAVMPIYG